MLDYFLCFFSFWNRTESHEPKACETIDMHYTVDIGFKIQQISWGKAILKYRQTNTVRQANNDFVDTKCYNISSNLYFLD